MHYSISLCLSHSPFAEVTEPELLKKALENALHVFDRASERGFSMSDLDIGSGFPVRSRLFDINNPSTPSSGTLFEDVAASLLQHVDSMFPASVRIIADATHFLSWSARTFVLNVVGKRRAIADADDVAYYVKHPLHSVTDDLYRRSNPQPLMISTVPHHIEQQSSTDSSSRKRKASTLHAVDHSGSFATTSVELPDLDIGDWIYVPNVGSLGADAADIAIKYIAT